MDVFAALSDPNRRRMLEELAAGERSAGEVGRSFEFSAPAVSQHLKALREAGLVRVRVDGQRRLYSLDPKGFEFLRRVPVPDPPLLGRTARRSRTGAARGATCKIPTQKETAMTATTMTDKAYGIITEGGAVRFERLLPGPIERVWEYLTDSGKRGTWFASGRMELWVGGRVELIFRHADLTPHAETPPERFRNAAKGGTTTGRITVCEPPRRLAFAWLDGPGGGSDVEFLLTEKGDDVLLVLTHSGLTDRGTVVKVSGGWHTHLGILADHLAGRVPAPFWATIDRLEPIYEGRTP